MLPRITGFLALQGAVYLAVRRLELDLAGVFCLDLITDLPGGDQGTGFCWRGGANERRWPA